MIDTIIRNIIDILKSDSYKAVYSAFDNIPYYSKENQICTYIGISEFDTKTPVYALSTVFIPFSSVIEISLTAPQDSSADILFSFFSSIMSKLGDSDYHINEIKGISIKPDTNIRKLVLKSSFSISGIFRKENIS